MTLGASAGPPSPPTTTSSRSGQRGRAGLDIGSRVHVREEQHQGHPVAHLDATRRPESRGHLRARRAGHLARVPQARPPRRAGQRARLPRRRPSERARVANRSLPAPRLEDTLHRDDPPRGAGSARPRPGRCGFARSRSAGCTPRFSTCAGGTIYERGGLRRGGNPRTRAELHFQASAEILDAPPSHRSDDSGCFREALRLVAATGPGAGAPPGAALDQAHHPPRGGAALHHLSRGQRGVALGRIARRRRSTSATSTSPPTALSPGLDLARSLPGSPGTAGRRARGMARVGPTT